MEKQEMEMKWKLETEMKTQPLGPSKIFVLLPLFLGIPEQ